MTVYLEYILLFVNKADNFVYFIKTRSVFYLDKFNLFNSVPNKQAGAFFSRRNICLGPKSTGDILLPESQSRLLIKKL